MDISHKVGYAVVGLGVGRTHVDAAAASENGKLVAVCDLRDDRLNAVKAQYPDVLLYHSFDELMKNPEVEAVSICLPSGLHAEYTIRALEAGKHVLCEKPIETTVEKAMKIEEARVRTGKKVGLIFQNRFNLPMFPLKEALAENRLGKLVLGTFAVKWYRPQSYYDGDGGWRGTWEMDGGGSLMNQGIHTLDLMQWLMGDVESVHSETGIYGHKMDTEDMTASVIRFRSGAVASFVTTTCAWPGISTDIQLYGTGGSVEIDGDRLKRWKLLDDPDEEADMLEDYGDGNARFAELRPGEKCGHARLVEDMIDAVKFDREPAVCPLEAMKAIRIAEAVYESARTGKTVYFQ